jgi:hypothetical protein
MQNKTSTAKKQSHDQTNNLHPVHCNEHKLL